LSAIIVTEVTRYRQTRHLVQTVSAGIIKLNLAFKDVILLFRRHLLLLLMTLSGIGTPVYAAVPPPNIVIFLMDDVGQTDIGVFGNPVIKTPNIDRLAHEGMRFDNAFLTTSSCTASRASILTGLYPHETGASGLGDILPANDESLPHLLKNAGYYTAAVGKWHLGEPFKSHFDRVVDMREDTGSADWLPEFARRPKDKPFFFWFASHDAHIPYDWKPPLKTYSPAEVIVQPWQSDTYYERQLISLYYNEITRADHSIGILISTLRNEGLLDNTIVIVLSDNGAMFGGAKARLYDEGLKTPLVMRFPPRITADITNTQLVSSVDLVPTLLEAAHIQVPSVMDGISLWPTIMQPEKPVRSFIFAERNNIEHPAFARAIRSNHFLFKRNYLGRRLCDPLNGLLIGERPRYRVHAEFYDLIKDPLAQHNLIHDPEYTSDIFRYRSMMNKLMYLQKDVAPPLILEQCEPMPWDKNIQINWPVTPNE
jgi:arylsulfatase